MIGVAKVNEIKLSYQMEGKGFPLILIHGYGATKEIWKPQMADLSKHFKVIAYDIRGLGKSDRPDYLYTMDHLVEDLRGLMDFLKISKAHVGGRSLGGMIAQNFVLKYPKRVEKLILITTNMGMPDEKVVDMMVESSVKEGEELQSNPEEGFWNKARLLYHRSFLKKLKQDPNYVIHGIGSLEELRSNELQDPPTAADLKNLGNAMKTHDTSKRIKEIQHDTLLIAAANDRLTPKSVMVKMDELLPNSQLEIIEKSGHYVTVSRANEVNYLILNFLSK